MLTFADSDSWPTWADKLLERLLEEAKRRQDLSSWYQQNCKAST